MPVTSSAKLIAFLSLISGLSISAVAVYYSVAGLLSIFAASPVPIMIMGTALEISKLVATVWLKQFWSIAPKTIKLYLSISVFVLMIITSIGIFGYLSKAHLDQGVPTGAVVDKLALLDEKIKTQKDNINAAKKALTQLDQSFDQTMARSSDERGASKAIEIRRSQNKERGLLRAEIETAQKEVSKLNDERAPIASELRKVEAEVGPIKYIAALIYGDSIDSNLLERAVRWMIILIVIVFDPLAVVLLLASQHSFRWMKESNTPGLEEPIVVINDTSVGNIITDDTLADTLEDADEVVVEEEIIEVKIESGTEFPTDPSKGDHFTRIDFVPERHFRYNGSQWIDADATMSRV